MKDKILDYEEKKINLSSQIKIKFSGFLRIFMVGFIIYKFISLLNIASIFIISMSMILMLITFYYNLVQGINELMLNRIYDNRILSFISIFGLSMSIVILLKSLMANNIGFNVFNKYETIILIICMILINLREVLEIPKEILGKK